jgi:hypothetical protein
MRSHAAALGALDLALLASNGNKAAAICMAYASIIKHLAGSQWPASWLAIHCLQPLIIGKLNWRKMTIHWLTRKHTSAADKQKNACRTRNYLQSCGTCLPCPCA